MHFIGLDIHKKTISYCVKDVSGTVLSPKKRRCCGTRAQLDDWVKTLPAPWTVAMEAAMFTGWIYDHLLPRAAAVRRRIQVDVAVAIAAAKKKNDRIDASKISRLSSMSTSCPSATWSPPRSSGATQDATLPQASGPAERTVAQHVSLTDADGVGRGLQQAEAPQGRLAQGTDGDQLGYQPQELKPLLAICRETIVRIGKDRGVH